MGCGDPALATGNRRFSLLQERLALSGSLSFMIMSEEESVMKKIGTYALLAVALLAIAASVPALAQGGSRGGSQGSSPGGSRGGTQGGSQGATSGGPKGSTQGASSHGNYYRGSHGGYYSYPRVRVGFAFGGPYWGYPGWGYPGWGYPGWGYAGWGYPGYYYSSPYYYYPQTVGVPAEATAYIERSDAAALPVQQSQGYWYYCPEPKAYYPYVKECAGGWQRVSPTPPGEIRK